MHAYAFTHFSIEIQFTLSPCPPKNLRFYMVRKPAYAYYISSSYFVLIFLAAAKQATLVFCVHAMYIGKYKKEIV